MTVHDFPCGANAPHCCDLVVFVRTGTTDVLVFRQLFINSEYGGFDIILLMLSPEHRRTSCTRQI